MLRLRQFFSRDISSVKFIEAAKKGGDDSLDIVNRYIRQSGDNAIDINIVDQGGSTALICAANNGYTAIVTALLAKEGIALNIANQSGYTALIRAAMQGHAAIVTALLAKEGIATNVPDLFGNTALIWAAHEGHSLVVSALLAKNDIAINAIGQHGNTALIWAAHNGDIDSVTALLTKNGIAINAADSLGGTALILAANKGHTAIVTALLAKDGIAINGAIQNGNTALICAAIKGHAAIVTALLLRVDLADLIHRNNVHRTAADEAAFRGCHDIAALIVAREQVLRAALENDGAISPERNAVANSVVSMALTPQERLERIHFVGDVPSELVCPIAADGRLMVDPVTVSSGKVFERKNLSRWCSEKLDVATGTFPCPLTRDPIHERELNYKSTTFVKSAIDNFVKTEEVKYANERQDIKNVIDELVQKIELRESLLRYSFKLNTVVNDQSSSSSSVYGQLPETEKVLVARKRLEFFKSQQKSKINNNSIPALSNNHLANADVVATSRISI